MIVIVNHDGRGWWDPLSEAKGDIFSLVQHLEPGLNFAKARHMLRGLVGGIAPTFPEAVSVRRARAPHMPCPPAVDPIRTMKSHSRRRYHRTTSTGLSAGSTQNIPNPPHAHRTHSNVRRACRHLSSYWLRVSSRVGSTGKVLKMWNSGTIT